MLFFQLDLAHCICGFICSAELMARTRTKSLLWQRLRVHAPCMVVKDHVNNVAWTFVQSHVCSSLTPLSLVMSPWEALLMSCVVEFHGLEICLFNAGLPDGSQPWMPCQCMHHWQDCSCSWWQVNTTVVLTPGMCLLIHTSTS